MDIGDEKKGRETEWKDWWS